VEEGPINQVSKHGKRPLRNICQNNNNNKAQIYFTTILKKKEKKKKSTTISKTNSVLKLS
jgi:type III secretory pathway component EscR